MCKSYEYSMKGCNKGPFSPYCFYHALYLFLGEIVMLTAVELVHRLFGRHPGGQYTAHSHPYFIPEDTKWIGYLITLLCYII